MVWNLPYYFHYYVNVLIIVIRILFIAMSWFKYWYFLELKMALNMIVRARHTIGHLILQPPIPTPEKMSYETKDVQTSFENRIDVDTK